MIVDVHCHIVVPEMLTAAAPAALRPEIGREDGRQVVRFRGRRLTSVTGEFCDADAMLAAAARQGVDHLLLSPWIMLSPVDVPADEALTACRIQNDALAGLAASRTAISALGVVPLADADAAARELVRLMGLGLAGAEIPASVSGACLGDDRFRPFWAAAEAAGALIFVHPTTRGLGLPALDDHYLWNSVGNPLETAITIAHLIAAGVPERYPRLRILLAHGGGALHAVRGRLRRAHEIRPEEAAADAPAGPDAALRRFYYDSLTHDQALLAGLIDYAGADHVLLGSDRPFDMGSDDPVGEVRALDLSAPDQQLILAGNARALLKPAPAGD